MADIIYLSGSSEPHRPHPDKTLLEIAGEWHVARAQARLCWAEHALRSLFDTQDAVIVSPDQALETMAQAEHYFKVSLPRTTLGARVLLDVVIDIQAARQIHPESTCAQGPTLEMLVNISRALDMDDEPEHVRFSRAPKG